MNNINISYVYREYEFGATVEGLASRLADVQDIDVTVGDTPRIWTNKERYSLSDGDTVVPDSYGTLRLWFGADALMLNPELLEDALRVTKRIYESTDPVYVFGMHFGHKEVIGLEMDEPVTTETLEENRLNTPTWLMLFPPAMVDAYGREWLLNLPVPYTEELGDGAILTLTMTDFEKFESDVDMLEALWEARESLEELFEARHAEL